MTTDHAPHAAGPAAGPLAAEMARYASLGWSVRLARPAGATDPQATVVALETGQAADVLEAPYAVGIVALEDWEQNGRPGPVWTDGIERIWFAVRAGRWPWPGAHHSGPAVCKILSERQTPVVRWWADALVPLPPSTLPGEHTLYWLSEPPSHLSPADLPRPLWTARLLGKAIDDIVGDDLPVLRIGNQALLVAAPISGDGVARALAATRTSAGTKPAPVPFGITPPPRPSGPRYPDGPAIELPARSTPPDRDRETPAAAAVGWERETPERAAPERSDSPPPTASQAAVETATAPAGDRPEPPGRELLVTWPGDPYGILATPDGLPALLDRIASDARHSHTPWLVTLTTDKDPGDTSTDSPALTIGAGGQASIAIWHDPGHSDQISQGDHQDDGTAIIFYAAEPAIYPITSTIHWNDAVHAAQQFARDGQQPSNLRWSPVPAANRPG